MDSKGPELASVELFAHGDSQTFFVVVATGNAVAKLSGLFLFVQDMAE
jgi:hypothetical protein